MKEIFYFLYEKKIVENRPFFPEETANLVSIEECVRNHYLVNGIPDITLRDQVRRLRFDSVETLLSVFEK